MCCSQQTRLKENTSEKFKMKGWAKGMAANENPVREKKGGKADPINLIIYKVE